MAKKQSQAKRRKAAVEKQKQQQQRRFQIIGIGALLLVVAVAVFSFVGNQNEPTNTAGLKVAPEVGAEAPDFELAGINGETVQLSDFRGKPVAVTFMHTW